VIVGDISIAEAEAAARDAFGGWRPDGEPVAAPPSLARVGSAAGGAALASLETPEGYRITHRPGATQTEVRLGCVLPPADPRREAVGDVAAEIVEADLEEALRHRTGSTYGVNAWAASFRGGGAVLELTAAVENAKLQPAVAALREYWAKAARGRTADARDIELARGALASGRLLAYERSSALAGALLRTWNRGWPLDTADHYAEHLASVTVEEVNATLAGCARGMVGALLGDEKNIRAALVAPTAAAP
jgi:predicted Zn-dependent peptidase